MKWHVRWRSTSLCSSLKRIRTATVDYFAAVGGGLNLVPQGPARDALAEDYAKMLEEEVMVGDALPFENLMVACDEVVARVNAAAVP